MMLGNVSVEGGARFSPTWDCEDDWQVVDRKLRAIAGERAALDAKEARWLREGDALKIWWRFGMVDMVDYMERRMGYTPHVAKERLRVARALGDLPAIEEALRDGELSFSAVRELTRVATPETEVEWLDSAADKNVRQIEELVAGHRPGDKPTDPADPQVRTHRVVLELSAETYAAFRQARVVLEDEHGGRLDDNALVAAMTGAVLAGSGEPDGRARAQIAITRCEKCRAGTQDGGGATIPISTAAIERAECDAQHIGSIDADQPARAHQDVSPAVARLVHRRDHGRCRVPGCRSGRALEIHHIVHREHGGSHDAENLVLLCSSCHTAHHDGRLSIAGTASVLEVRRSHVGLNRPPLAEEATTALAVMGWKRKIARAAVEHALAEVQTDSLEVLIRRRRRSSLRENRVFARFTPTSLARVPRLAAEPTYRARRRVRSPRRVAPI